MWKYVTNSIQGLKDPCPRALKLFIRLVVTLTGHRLNTYSVFIIFIASARANAGFAAGEVCQVSVTLVEEANMLSLRALASWLF